MSLAYGGDLGLETRAIGECHRFVVEVAPVRGLETIGVVDQHGLDGVVAACPVEPWTYHRRWTGRAFGTVASRSGGDFRVRAGRRAQQPSGGDLTFAVGEARVELRDLVDRDKVERQFLLGREKAKQVGIEPFHVAPRPREVDDRAGPHQHDELVGTLPGTRRHVRTRRRRRHVECEHRGRRRDEGCGCDEDAARRSHFASGSATVPARTLTYAMIIARRRVAQGRPAV